MDTVSNVILYIIAVLLGIIGYFLIRFIKSVDDNNKLTSKVVMEQALQSVESKYLKEELDEIKKEQINKGEFDSLKKDVESIKEWTQRIEKSMYP